MHAVCMIICMNNSMYGICEEFMYAMVCMSCIRCKCV